MMEGLQRNSVYVTNSVTYHVPNDKDPSAEDIRRDATDLREELVSVAPKFIGLLGAVASRHFLGSDFPMEALHGLPYKAEICRSCGKIQTPRDGEDSRGPEDELLDLDAREKRRATGEREAGASVHLDHGQAGTGTYISIRGHGRAGSSRQATTPQVREPSLRRPQHLEPLTRLQHEDKHRPKFCKWGHPLRGRNVYNYRGKRGRQRTCYVCMTMRGHGVNPAVIRMHDPRWKLSFYRVTTRH